MLKYLKDAIKILGGQAIFAERLGLKQPTISTWITVYRRAPAKHAIAIEKLTQGKITRYQLRPDIYPIE